MYRKNNLIKILYLILKLNYITQISPKRIMFYPASFKKFLIHNLFRSDFKLRGVNSFFPEINMHFSPCLPAFENTWFITKSSRERIAFNSALTMDRPPLGNKQYNTAACDGCFNLQKMIDLGLLSWHYLGAVKILLTRNKIWLYDTLTVRKRFQSKMRQQKPEKL